MVYIVFWRVSDMKETRNQLEQEKNFETLKYEKPVIIRQLKGGLENFVLDHELMYINELNRAGWDYLYENCFEGINEIVANNVRGGEHNEKLVDEVYQKMLQSLEKSKEKMDELGGDKESWYVTYNIILEFSQKAHTPSLKVITINIIDQHLRSTY